MAPSRVVGGLSSTSSNSGIFFQNDVHSHNMVNSHLGPSFVNIPNSVMGPGCSNLVPVSGDVNNNPVLSSVANSGPSIGASSLVTDANSALTGGQHLQRSGSNNTESYPCLPASPISFSSNNISISGSSVMDGSPVVQLNANQDHNSQAAQQCQQQQQGISGATSIPSSQINQASLPMVTRGISSFIQDPNSLTHMQKKSRMDMKQEEFLQQQVIQQLLQRQDSMQMQQGHNPQFQAMLQQQRIRQQQQQILQSMPQLQRAQLQQQQQMQLRHHLQQQGMPSLATMKRPVDSGVCSRRLMQYLYHQRQRPSDNSIAYWRKFVAEYFSPRAKKRWCLSLYENVGHHALGVFPQQDAWHCDICNSKSGRGFEATFEVLPRLSEIKFSSGVTDELLFLDLPREVRFPSGILILEYAKAVQESVYEQLRVIREGQLRITFTPDLKILYWEFCGRRHEELLPRRLVAPQVNQLVQAAQKCKSSTENGSEMTSQQDLQANSNLVLAAGHQLAKCLELQSLNDLGFSKRYVRCLQIAEVVNSMKDLIDFCKEHKVGPIDGLKSYPQHTTMNRFQMPKLQEMEQTSGMQGLPTDRNVLNKLMALQPGQNGQISNPHHHHHVVGRGATPPNGLSLASYQNLLMRQNSINSNMIHHSDPSSPINGPYQGQSAPLVQSAVTSYSPSGFPAPHLQQQHLQQQQQQQHLQRSPSVNSLMQQPTGQVNQALQQHMIQQLLQDMNNGTGSASQQQNSLSSAHGGGGGMRGGGCPSRNNSFKGDSSGDNTCFSQKMQDVSHNISLTEEDLGHDFADNGFFNSVLDDSMGYGGWKG